MKRLLAVVLALSLSGCALVDAYLLAKYDSNEYLIITEIRTDAGKYKQQCDNSDKSKINADLIADKTLLFMNYSQHIAHNKNTIAAAEKLNEIAQGLQQRYTDGKVSPAFCKIKFDSISNSAETMQTVIGNKPR